MGVGNERVAEFFDEVCDRHRLDAKLGQHLCAKGQRIVKRGIAIAVSLEQARRIDREVVKDIALGFEAILKLVDIDAVVPRFFLHNAEDTFIGEFLDDFGQKTFGDLLPELLGKGAGK